MITETKMRLRQKELSAEIDQLRKRLADMPVGHLECRKHGSTYQWYVRTEKETSYLKRIYRETAEKLALKTYLERRLKEMQNERSAIGQYLRCRSKCPVKTAEKLLQLPPYKDLLRPQVEERNQRIQAWLDIPRTPNRLHPENLKIRMSDGTLVRSKSEGMIYRMLKEHNIPFRYDCEMWINGELVCPDFLIYHPKTGEIFIWEHLGRMDDPLYLARVHRTIEVYAGGNWLPGRNLILSSENAEHPLGEADIERLIDAFFA